MTTTLHQLAFFLGVDADDQSEIALAVGFRPPVARAINSQLKKSSSFNLWNVIVNKVRKAVTVVRQKTP